MKSPNEEVQKPTLRIIGNFVTGTDLQTDFVLDSILPILSEFLKTNNKASKKEVCWIISNICAGNVKQIRSIVEYNFFPHLVHFVFDSPNEIKREGETIFFFLRFLFKNFFFFI